MITAITIPIGDALKIHQVAIPVQTAKVIVANHIIPQNLVFRSINLSYPIKNGINPKNRVILGKLSYHERANKTPLRINNNAILYLGIAKIFINADKDKI
mgnify:CR=1 FL=1